MDSIRCKSNIHENIERNTFMSKELQIRNSTVDFLVFTRDAGADTENSNKSNTTVNNNNESSSHIDRSVREYQAASQIGRAHV